MCTSLSSSSSTKGKSRRRLRFYRFVYASLTIYSVFAVVVAFFQVNQVHQYKSSEARFRTHSDDSMVLYWFYIFDGSALAAAWFLVYFGDISTCWNLKRLRRGHHYKLNLLIASLLAAVFYTCFFWGVLKMEVQTGPKLLEAIIIAQCELMLIGAHMLDEQEIRRERHARKRLLRERQRIMEEAEHLHSITGGMI